MQQVLVDDNTNGKKSFIKDASESTSTLPLAAESPESASILNGAEVFAVKEMPVVHLLAELGSNTGADTTNSTIADAEDEEEENANGSDDDQDNDDDDDEDDDNQDDAKSSERAQTSPKSDDQFEDADEDKDGIVSEQARQDEELGLFHFMIVAGDTSVY